MTPDMSCGGCKRPSVGSRKLGNSTLSMITACDMGPSSDRRLPMTIPSKVQVCLEQSREKNTRTALTIRNEIRLDTPKTATSV